MKLKGQITGPMMLVLVAAVLILICGLVYGELRAGVQSSINSLNQAGLNSTIDTVDANTWSSISLTSVSVIVLAAFGIILIVKLLMGGAG